MVDIRGSLSKMKKKAKHLLTGKKRKPDGTATNPGEGADSASLLLQPEPHVVVDKSYDREGDKAGVTGEPVFSTDQLPPQPDGPGSVPACGSDDGQQGGEADFDGGEASQIHSRTHPDVEIDMGGGYGGEPEGAHPSPSAPSIPHNEKPDST